MTAAQTSKQRAERNYRARRLAAGDKLLRVWMTPAIRSMWEAALHEYGRSETVLAAAIGALLSKSIHQVGVRNER